MGKIKPGVTLYSFSTEYCQGKMSLEDCIRTARELGAEGFEIVATQMIPCYPFIDDRFAGELAAMCRYYDIEAVSYGANMDKGLRGDRSLTDDEMLQFAIRDIRNAHKLGCKVIREQWLIGPENFGRLAPYAEAYGVKVGIEIHNPDSPISPMIMQFREVLDRVNSPYLGFVPDFGCFAVKPNKPGWDNAIRDGAKEELLEMARDFKYADVPEEEAIAKMKEAGAGLAELTAMRDMYGFMQFKKDVSAELQGLREIIPRCVHMHGKYHYLYENYEEASIPYQDILQVLKEEGYEGYIVSEYEMYHSDCSIEMLRRHQQLLRKYI